MNASSRFAAFAVPAFRRYVAAHFLAQAGTWFQTLAVSLAVAQRTGDAYALSGVAVATLPPLDPHLPRLHPQHLGDGDAVGLGLHDGADEPAQVGQVRPPLERPVGVDARLPDPDVVERAAELLGERSLAVRDGLRHRGVETEARLDGDRHLVERVRQRA